ncbi:MAG: hypothetical protein ABI972_02380 [Acidobacteriota bacterium]
MADVQPHIKSCMNCIERYSGEWPCVGLEKYRIVFIENTTAWVGCPFMPSAGEIKGWLSAPPTPIEPTAKARIEHLQKMRNRQKLGGYLAEGQPDSAGFQSHICCYPYGSSGSRSGVFLRRTDNSKEILNKVRSVFHGGVSESQRRQIEATPSLRVLPKISQKKPSEPRKEFIHYPKITAQDCGLDFDGLERAWERGGMLIQVSAVDGYHPNLKLVAVLQKGLGRIEKAVIAGMSPKHLGEALAELLPNDKQAVAFGLQLAAGIALQAGIALGVAALGSAAGWAFGNFALPGLGGAAGAAAGGTLATGIYNFVLRAYDVADTGSQIAGKSKDINEAGVMAWQGQNEAATKKFAKIFAEIILAAMLILLAKVVAERAKGKKNTNLSKEGQIWVDSETRRSSPRVPRVKLKLSFAGLKKFTRSRASEVGMLAEEIDALAKLAAKGYYIAVRSCNKSRIKWLKSGHALNAKPLWLPIKSLGFGDFKGLVGFSRIMSKNRGTYVDYPKAIRQMKKITPGGKFNPTFLDGKSYEGPFALKEGVIYDFLYKDTSSNSKLLFLKVGDEYIAVDHNGRPWIPDLDVTILQKRSKTGAYLPPGVGIMGDRPHQHGSDAPDIESDLNGFFRSNVTYPDGYDPIQHGGRGGSANYMKDMKDPETKKRIHEGHAYEPIWQKPGWAPGDAEEGHHVIAADGLDGFLAEANDMSELQKFHEANPMGVWRW